MKKILVIVGLVVVAIIIFMIPRSLGFGDGQGSRIGSPIEKNLNTIIPVEATKQNSGKDSSESNLVIIKIQENKVFIGKEEYINSEELRTYLENTNTDKMIYELEEERAILATYEWVKKVFEDLQIPLKETNNN